MDSAHKKMKILSSYPLYGILSRKDLATSLVHQLSSAVNDVMLHFSRFVPTKKQTCLHLGRGNVNFLVNDSFKYFISIFVKENN